MEFIGLSRESLQQAMLNRLGELASLRKESKQHREKLSEARSEMARLNHELKQIEAQLERIVAIPQAPQESKVVEMPRQERKRA